MQGSHSAMAEKCLGVSDEWHLVISKSFHQKAFEFVPRLHESIEVFGSSFCFAGFDPIRSVSDAVDDDCFKQVLIQFFAA